MISTEQKLKHQARKEVEVAGGVQECSTEQARKAGQAGRQGGGQQLELFSSTSTNGAATAAEGTLLMARCLTC